MARSQTTFAYLVLYKKLLGQHSRRTWLPVLPIAKFQKVRLLYQLARHAPVLHKHSKLLYADRRGNAMTNVVQTWQYVPLGHHVRWSNRERRFRQCSVEAGLGMGHTVYMGLKYTVAGYSYVCTLYKPCFGLSDPAFP